MAGQGWNIYSVIFLFLQNWQNKRMMCLWNIMTPTVTLTLNYGLDLCIKPFHTFAASWNSMCPEYGVIILITSLWPICIWLWRMTMTCYCSTCVALWHTHECWSIKLNIHVYIFAFALRCILHDAALFFYREQLYGLAPLISALLDFFIRAILL